MKYLDTECIVGGDKGADSAKDPKEHAETVFKEVPGKEKPLFGSEEWFCFLVDVSTSCASQSIRS
jgi:hypothetical protein